MLFEEEGFRGDEESYDEPSNSSVGRVLARRRGMPITLSIVAMEVGKLAGLRLTGIGLPGHFVVGGPDLPEGMYLDPFGGGALCDAEALSRRLGAIFGAPVALGSDALRPDPARTILARVLLNLRRSYERRNRWEDALRALELSEALEPQSGPLLRERGLLLLKCGRGAEAVVALEAYVETAGAEDAEPVAKLIETIRESGVTEDAEPEDGPRKIFTLEEARALLPRVKELTSDAVARFSQLPGDQEDERRADRGRLGRRARSARLRDQGLVARRFRFRRRVLLLEVPGAGAGPLPRLRGRVRGAAGAAVGAPLDSNSQVIVRDPGTMARPSPVGRGPG